MGSLIRSVARKAVIVPCTLFSAAWPLSGARLEVGPGKPFTKPCEAFAAAAPGDIIEIDAAGDYDGDVCVIRPDNLTIRGVGGRAKIDAAGKHAEGKGIWVIDGDNITVENIEFSGAKVPDRNGAGIRIQGRNLTVRNCYFHDNEDGILGGHNQGHILIEYCEFARNGYGNGYTHNIYIGHTERFTLRYSYSHDGISGHLVKSRAAENFILYNLLDTGDGTSSYEIDLPNGGFALVLGNVIRQGVRTENSVLLTYREEGPDARNPSEQLIVAHNTFINDRPRGTFIRLAAAVSTPALVRNNIFVGPGTLVSQPGARLEGNLHSLDPGVIGGREEHYRLRQDSPAVDAGVEPGEFQGRSLAPTSHYLHPACGEGRALVSGWDLGAFEFGGRKAPLPDAPERCQQGAGDAAVAVVNAATFTLGPLAPGSLVSLFGNGLADREEAAATIPLPRTLAGVTVMVDGTPLPLYYASPGQVNAQLPVEVAPGRVRLTCVRSGLEGPDAVLTLQESAPGIFTYPGSDRAVAINNKGWSLNGPDNPVRPGEVVVVYVTGQGPVEPPVPTGEAAPESPLSYALLPASARIGGQPSEVLFLGLAPDMVGVAQANLLVPDVPAGEHLLVLTVGGESSPPVKVFVGR